MRLLSNLTLDTYLLLTTYLRRRALGLLLCLTLQHLAVNLISSRAAWGYFLHSLYTYLLLTTYGGSRALGLLLCQTLRLLAVNLISSRAAAWGYFLHPLYTYLLLTTYLRRRALGLLPCLTLLHLAVNLVSSRAAGSIARGMHLNMPSMHKCMYAHTSLVATVTMVIAISSLAVHYLTTHLCRLARDLRRHIALGYRADDRFVVGNLLLNLTPFVC